MSGEAKPVMEFGSFTLRVQNKEKKEKATGYKWRRRICWTSERNMVMSFTKLLR
uniref:Uncharacterized protein n=1 Tax=Brassica oleracea TaxID=3712 RepID=A0A3P6H4B2_BRAOL|nr:unnamed protein product [Brassica oleracea]